MEKIKQTKILIEKIYKVEELIKLFGDVIEDYINQVVLMKDEELEEDRSEWIKRYGDYDDRDKYKYETSIHTIAIEIEQIRRWKKIIYDIPKKSVRLD
jgi:esterase/lipase|tara:strand:- start:1887 stop:2180 length:294 start_codon:yes stop_codon:yes gene_type:complete